MKEEKKLEDRDGRKSHLTHKFTKSRTHKGGSAFMGDTKTRQSFLPFPKALQHKGCVRMKSLK